MGELVALDWQAVNLTEGTITIRHTFNPVDGLTTPKDSEERTVYLTPDAQAWFEEWVGKVGAHDSGLRLSPAPAQAST